MNVHNNKNRLKYDVTSCLRGWDRLLAAVPKAWMDQMTTVGLVWASDQMLFSYVISKLYLGNSSILPLLPYVALK